MKFLKYISLFSLFVLIISCSDDKIADFETPRSQYTGVSEYDSQGNKIRQVDSDWHPRCYEVLSFDGNHFCFFNTYPLPAIDTLTLGIGSAIVGNYKIWLAINDSTSVMSILDEKKSIGGFELKIPFDKDKLHRNVVYRLFVETTDSLTNETQIHFGDVIWN